MQIKYYIILFIAAQLLNCHTAMNDSVLIKELLEKESATWRASDFKGHSDCWHIQPYSKILVSNAITGKTYDVPPALMKDSTATMGDGGSSINSNYKMSIHGDNAWVSHEEVSTAKDGANTYSYEIRILEKVEGKWKLVGQSIHIYTP
jgi:hypothetical protein